MFPAMDGAGLLVLLLALLVGIPLIVSLVTSNSARVVGGIVDSTRSHAATKRRAFLSELGAETIAGTLYTAFDNADFTIKRDGLRLTGVSANSVTFEISVAARGRGSRIDVTADETEIETVAAAILSELRAVDPSVRVKTVGA
jgi:hypothetical protein